MPHPCGTMDVMLLPSGACLRVQRLVSVLRRTALTKLFTSPTVAEVGLLQGLLEQNGIRCVMRNEQTAMASGAIPFTDTWPELWVLNEADTAKAQELLNQWQSASTSSSEPWTCPNCGEEVEGQFTACWNCSKPRAA